MKKIYFASVVIALAILGAYFFPRSVDVHQVGTTTQGGTFDTARQASVVVALATPGANATSSSIFNGSGSDRYVTAVKAGCQSVGTSKTAYTGSGLVSLQLSVGTSSTAAPVIVPTNIIGGTAFIIGTTTVQYALASSSIGVGSASMLTLWPDQSYMTFWFNATNTANCTVGVDYFSS